uniref:Transposase n=1 Tax=Syphacia muris TaxID=451379 RepID=A0A0N5AD57_9BILA
MLLLPKSQKKFAKYQIDQGRSVNLRTLKTVSKYLDDRMCQLLLEEEKNLNLKWQLEDAQKGRRFRAVNLFVANAGGDTTSMD